jgi:hypothetical protein
MEEVGPSRKVRFILVQGVLLWGGSVALFTWFLDWHRTGHADSIYGIVWRFAICMTCGYFCGLWMWKTREITGRRQVSRDRAIADTVLFLAVMGGLAYLLWRMS